MSKKGNYTKEQVRHLKDKMNWLHRWIGRYMFLHADQAFTPSQMQDILAEAGHEDIDRNTVRARMSELKRNNHLFKIKGRTRKSPYGGFEHFYQWRSWEQQLSLIDMQPTTMDYEVGKTK